MINRIILIHDESNHMNDVLQPGDETAYIVCVDNNPRIHYCGDNSVFDSQTLTCIYYEQKHLQPQFAGRPQAISPFGK